MGRGKCSKVKNLCRTDQFFIHFFFFQHHICSRIPVEREISVTVRISMYERKCGMYFFIHYQIPCINSNFFDCSFQLFSEHIFSDFSDKCGLFPELFKHCEYIARCASRIGFQEWISLCARSIFCKINQQFA